MLKTIEDEFPCQKILLKVLVKILLKKQILY